MANEFYNHSSFPAQGTVASSSAMRAELDLIGAGFEKMPALAGNASKLVQVNPAGTGLLALATALPLSLGGTGATTAALARAAIDAPQTTGTSATGTWPIGITGTAATATTAAGLSSTLALSSGGTGQTTASAARSAFGAAASGANADITGLSALTSLPLALSSVGVGQTWQDKTSARTASTTYTNSTGKPIVVTVAISLPNGQSGSLQSGSVSTGVYNSSAGTVMAPVSLVIPDGVSYIVGTTGSINSWNELR